MNDTAREILFKPESMVRKHLSQWMLKGCPRCGGDLELLNGEFLEYVCLQCGHHADLRQPEFVEGGPK